MDFSKPTRGLVTPYFKAKHEAPADDFDPNEMYIWQPVLGPADSSGPTSPNPMSIIGPGAVMPSLASRLNWSVLAGTDHQQVQIKLGEAVISVDQGMAEVIVLLNRAGVATVTSCIGSERVYGFVMVVGFGSVQKFMQIWECYLVPLGHPMPTLDFDARDSEWRADVGSEYPFGQQVPVDGVGLTYTAIWRNYPEDLALVMPRLVWALRRYLGGS